MELGQPEARLGSGTAGFQPQLRADTLNTSLRLSGPQFTLLEPGGEGGPTPWVLPILTCLLHTYTDRAISSASIYSVPTAYQALWWALSLSQC